MAITAALLAGAASGTDATTYDTASFDPATGRLNLFAVCATRASSLSPDQPTIQTTGGSGDTWDLVRALDYDVSGTTRAGVWVFRSMGDYAASARRITFANTTTSCCWSVVEFDNVDTSGTNGSGAIVQSGDTGAGDSGTSNSITLSALAAATSAVYGALAHQSNEAVTPGMTNELHDVAQNSPANALQTEWDINDTVADWSWATSVANGGIAVEIAAGGSIKTVTPGGATGSTVATSAVSAFRAVVPGGATGSTVATASVTRFRAVVPSGATGSTVATASLEAIAAVRSRRSLMGVGV